MKTFIRIIAVLAISVALGLAVYTIIQPVAPAVSFAQGANQPGARNGERGMPPAAAPAGAGAPAGQGAPVGARGGAGHPQVSVLGQIGPVLLKFAAMFIAVAGARALLARRKPRERSIPNEGKS
jgi:hypothetical protein